MPVRKAGRLWRFPALEVESLEAKLTTVGEGEKAFRSVDLLGRVHG